MLFAIALAPSQRRTWTWKTHQRVDLVAGFHAVIIVVGVIVGKVPARQKSDKKSDKVRQKIRQIGDYCV
jgi:hypothetical protein